MFDYLPDVPPTPAQSDPRVAGEWVEVGWSDGGVDWAWRETTVFTYEARCLMPLRAMVSGVIDLLDRVDDLAAAQRDAGEILS